MDAHFSRRGPGWSAVAPIPHMAQNPPGDSGQSHTRPEPFTRCILAIGSGGEAEDVRTVKIFPADETPFTSAAAPRPALDYCDLCSLSSSGSPLITVDAVDIRLDKALRISIFAMIQKLAVPKRPTRGGQEMAGRGQVAGRFWQVNGRLLAGSGQAPGRPEAGTWQAMGRFWQAKLSNTMLYLNDIFSAP